LISEVSRVGEFLLECGTCRLIHRATSPHLSRYEHAKMINLAAAIYLGIDSLRMSMTSMDAQAREGWLSRTTRAAIARI
jgi:hypothetical protein